MFVIADIEWYTDFKGIVTPTQISAIKVSEEFEEESDFYERMKPFSKARCDWAHVAFTGAAKEAFIFADTAYAVLERFEAWLDDDDILIWWHESGKAQYIDSLRHILHKGNDRVNIILRPFIMNRLFYERNKICHSVTDASNILRTKICEPEHYSRADVETLRRIIIGSGIKCSELLQEEPDISLIRSFSTGDYCIDSEGVCHSKFCKKAGKLSEATPCAQVPGGVKLCDCVKRRIKNIRRKKNKSIMTKSGCAFAYIKGSEVFHSAECRCIESAKNITPVSKYETLVKKGLRPCKICCPQPKKQAEVLSQGKNKQGNVSKTGKAQSVAKPMKREIREALKRHNVARNKRARLLKECDGESPTQDIMILTNPGYAFFSAKGYSNYHLASCPRLNGKSDLKGYATCREASRAGYTPCKHCKPTEKNNIARSVPMFSEKRKEDSPYTLVGLCRKKGMDVKYDGDYIEITTPVGFWRVLTTKMPIELEHINRVVTPGNISGYHIQPRIFLSFVDVYSYIRRHDANLTEKIR